MKPASGRTPVRDVLLGIMSDERKERDFEAAMASRTIDAVLTAGLLVASLATAGGAAAAMAITAGGAAANVAKAGVTAGIVDTRAATLGDAQIAAVSDAGALVTRETVSAAQIEAYQAKMDLIMTAISALQDVGIAGLSPHPRSHRRRT